MITGSPRRGGNTDILLDRAEKSFNKHALSPKRVILSDMDILPCRACYRCVDSGRCVIKDDMHGLYNLLDLSNIIVIASPIFFGSVSAQIKIMADRMQSRWLNMKQRGEIEKNKKKCGAIILCGARNDEGSFECAEKVIKMMFRVLGIEYCGSARASGVDEKKDILKKMDVFRGVDAIMEEMVRRGRKDRITRTKK